MLNMSVLDLADFVHGEGQPAEPQSPQAPPDDAYASGRVVTAPTGQGGVSPDDPYASGRVVDDQPTGPGAISRFGGEFYHKSPLGPAMDLVTGTANVVRHPFNTYLGLKPLAGVAAGVLESHWDQAVRAAEKLHDAYVEGKTAAGAAWNKDARGADEMSVQAQASAVEAFGHAVAALLPLIGPAAANVGEHYAGGDIAGGAGGTVGLLLPFAVHEAMVARRGGQVWPRMGPQPPGAPPSPGAPTMPVEPPEPPPRPYTPVRPLQTLRNRVDALRAEPTGPEGSASDSFAPHDMTTLVDDIRKPDGGFTYNVTTGEQPTTGFAVSVYKGVERTIPAKVSSGALLNNFARFVVDNMPKLNEDGNFFGAWHNPKDGRIYLDISRVVPDAETANRIGAENGQVSYFDLANKTAHDVDSSVTTGGGAHEAGQAETGTVSGGPAQGAADSGGLGNAGQGGDGGGAVGGGQGGGAGAAGGGGAGGGQPTEVNPKAARLRRQATDIVAKEVLAPGNQRYVRTAQKIAPEILERGLRDKISRFSDATPWQEGTRAKLRVMADAGMDEAGARIENATNIDPKAPIQLKPIVDGLDAAISDYQSAGKTIPGYEGLVKALTAQRDYVKGLGDGTSVAFDELRRVWQKWGKAAADAKVYARAGNQEVGDAGQAAATAYDVTRGELTRGRPELAAANADYTFFKRLSEVLDPTIGRPKQTNFVPTGVTGGMATAGAIVGHGLKGHPLLGSVAGLLLIPRLMAFVKSPAFKLASAAKKWEAADALRDGNLTKLQSLMTNITMFAPRGVAPWAATTVPAAAGQGQEEKDKRQPER